MATKKKKTPTKKTAAKTTTIKSKSNISKKPTAKVAQRTKPSLKRYVKNRRTRRKAQKVELRASHVKLSTSLRLFRDSISVVRQHWKLYLAFTAIYLVLSFFLVGTVTGGLNITRFEQTLGDQLNELSTSLALFSILLSSYGKAGSQVGASYQTIILVMVSLAVIWALRHIHGGAKVTVRDAFYRGMHPLIPFMLVLMYLCLLFLPAIVASFIFATVFGNGLAVGWLETTLWAIVVFGLLMWSLRLLVTYVFSLYVVTLPETRPVAAIRSARLLVLYRRWSVTRRLLFLPIALILVGMIILIPILLLSPVAAQWIFLVLSMFVPMFVHTYLYSLYKELLANG